MYSEEENLDENWMDGLGGEDDENLDDHDEELETWKQNKDF